MNTEYWTITFEKGEFEKKFPKLAKDADLNKSDKIRVALGLEPRKAKAGAPKDNKNAIGNRGRWSSSRRIA